ncbi:MAG: ribosome silencing factor [Acidobacteriota bacterium]
MNNSEPTKFSEKLKKWRIPPGIKKAASLIADKKGEDISILKLKGISDITDFMIICNGNSVIQNRAISSEIQKTLKKELNLKPLGVEGVNFGDWILIDYVDFIVHIFSRETRGKFSLEKLWMDAKRYDL